jgi:hypothetical protein
MRVLSIDIGVHNMAFYLEEFDEKTVAKEKSVVAKNARYQADGTPTPQWAKLKDRVYKNGTTILHRRVDLSKEKGTSFLLSTFINLSTFLESNLALIESCEYIIIEQQLKTNPMAQRLEQHIVSWLTFMFLDTKGIVIFPSRHKTQVLGAPKRVVDKTGKSKKMTKVQRKNWACDEAQHILSLRDDIKGLHYIFSENRSKKDDLSDVIVQLNAFKIKLFIDGVEK